jgi:large subunit ribosomal protein L18
MNIKLITIRNKRKTRVRGKIKSRSTLPRLIVVRSLNHISAQVVDTKGRVMAEATSKGQAFKDMTKLMQATEVGNIIATKIKSKKINAVVLDRGSYKYHGRVKALAEAAKASGIKI